MASENRKLSEIREIECKWPTHVTGSERIFRGEEQNRFVDNHRHGVRCAPSNAVRGAAGYPRDLVAVQALNQRRLTIHRGRSAALLAVVIVTPCVHLNNTISK